MNFHNRSVTLMNLVRSRIFVDDDVAIFCLQLLHRKRNVEMQRSFDTLLRSLGSLKKTPAESVKLTRFFLPYSNLLFTVSYLSSMDLVLNIKKLRFKSFKYFTPI